MAPSSLHTTLGDYARFLTHLLNLDRAHGRETDLMLAPNGSVNKDLNWGLGLGLLNGSDGDLFWHFGHNFHSRACFAINRNTQQGILVLTNSHNGMSLCEEAITRLFPSSGAMFEWIRQQ